MKKSILIALFLFAVSASFAQSRWNMSVGLGGTTNVVRFDSGDEMANALFRSDHFRSGGLNVGISYKLTDKFSLQSGFDFTEFGFNYTIGKDYSLKEQWTTEPDISASTCITSIPVMFVMRTPKNCSNIRFVFGAGFAVRGIDEEWDVVHTETVSVTESGVQKSAHIAENSRTVNSLSPAITWMLGLEKVFKKGNSFGFYFRGNQGLNTIAESTVNYAVDGKSYTHTFINRGSFANCSIAYNFSAFGTRKALKAAAAVAPVAP
jgi:hypothetical protein